MAISSLVGAAGVLRSDPPDGVACRDMADAQVLNPDGGRFKLTANARTEFCEASTALGYSEIPGPAEYSRAAQIVFDVFTAAFGEEPSKIELVFEAMPAEQFVPPGPYTVPSRRDTAERVQP